LRQIRPKWRSKFAHGAFVAQLPGGIQVRSERK